MNFKNKKPYLIVVDWGTSSFRARCIDKQGNIIDMISTNEGILKSHPNFEETLFNNIIKLKYYSSSIPIILSGMIGSKNGWKEISYINLPCSIDNLSNKIIRLDNKNNAKILLIPGVCKIDKYPDVIRGEETEVLGAISSLNLKNASIIITGTHSKLIKIEDKKIVNFRTFLTGEMFYALSKASILGAFKNEVDHKSIWFKKGVDIGFNTKHGGDLLNAIFLARSNILCGDLPEKYSLSYLSGVLIGAEIGASNYEQNHIWIMGNGNLPLVYSSALQHLNYSTDIIDENCIIKGYLSIYNTYLRNTNEQ
ncbi:2-dehydro-3-deoxygalactonokinase [Gallibacterium anatis]|uniref:2-dehydro-3-deoxygalactonokinase n=1 Tax=Gallibacterium anatis TaxID=750 RepID=UPI00068EA7DE|nr:2-dehydro-3-deoxygalactonokinase [Gallibacterium anatis]